ncbi:MAG TPA: hypothetical protein PLB36_02985 [Bacillota bacterium]|nr:hypothetical protein [Bacillota bacterium]HPP60742.1 hypothetical protein [Bacillota bacterium]
MWSKDPRPLCFCFDCEAQTPVPFASASIVKHEPPSPLLPLLRLLHVLAGILCLDLELIVWAIMPNVAIGANGLSNGSSTDHVVVDAAQVFLEWFGRQFIGNLLLSCLFGDRVLCFCASVITNSRRG